MRSLTMTLAGMGFDARSGCRGRVTLALRVLVVLTMPAAGLAGACLAVSTGTVLPLAVAA